MLANGAIEYILQWFLRNITEYGSVVAEALCHKLEAPGLDSDEVDSACSRNEHQKSFWA
jgi:hypothetical protein